MAAIRYITLNALLLLVCMSAFASHPNWLNLTNSNHITAITSKDNNLWVGSRGGGLAKIDLTTGNKTFYNKANSGLPSNQVEVVRIDEQDNIWIGTYDQGLVRFDGQNWDVFNRVNMGLAIRNDIYDIQLDEDGNVWIGSLFNITKFDGTTYTDYPLPGYTGATSLLVLAPNDIYAVWHTLGSPAPMFHFNGSSVDTIKGLDYEGAYKLHKDSQNRIWVCYYGGIALKDGNDWVYFDSTNSAITHAQARSITEWNGTLYLGTEDGIFTFNGTTWVGSTIDEENVNYLHHHGSNLYVGTLSHGLFKTQGINNQLQKVQASNSKIPSNSFSSMIKDANGKLYFNQSWGNSQTHFANNVWSQTPNPVGLGSYVATALAPDQTMWYCNYDSLYLFDGQQIQKWSLRDNGYPGSGISAFEVDPFTGKVYIGTYTDGFMTFDGTTFTLYDRSNSTLSSNRITSFAFINNAVWIGTNADVVQQVQYGGGIEVFNGNTFSLMHPGNSGLMSKYISHLLVSGDSVWIGGDMGFGVYYNGNFTNYLYNNGSGNPLTFIKHFAISPTGKVFAAGYNIDSEGTMVKFSNGSFEVFDGNNSPIAEYAYRMFDMGFDNEGNLWILHADGVFIYKEGGVTSISEDIFSGIADAQKPTVAKLYPNPAHSLVTLEVPSGTGTIAVYNFMGQMVWQASISQHLTTIDIANWNTGVYIYKIQTPTGTHSGKLLVE